MRKNEDGALTKSKLAFSIAMEMVDERRYRVFAHKAGNKCLKPGDIDDFCDKAIEKIEKFRKDWKKIQHEE